VGPVTRTFSSTDGKVIAVQVISVRELIEFAAGCACESCRVCVCILGRDKALKGSKLNRMGSWRGHQ
jgi:hypothetical protein